MQNLSLAEPQDNLTDVKILGKRQQLDHPREDVYQGYENEWWTHYSNQPGKTFQIHGKPVEYCWPPGAPLKDCLDGKVDEVFMQPRVQIEHQLNGRGLNSNKIWPK